MTTFSAGNFNLYQQQQQQAQQQQQQQTQINPQGLWGGDQQSVMLQMGLQYGQSVLRGSEQSFMQHMPFVTNVRRYFSVDNQYVKRKLLILLWPFTSKFKKEERCQSGENELSGGTSSAFGGDPPSFSATNTTESTYLPPLPLNDVYAFDLYLPLMGVITYIILSGFVHGLHHNSVTNDYFLSLASALFFWIFIEVIVLKIANYFFRLVPKINFFSLLAITCYKYISVSFIVLCRELLHLESDAWYVGFMATYVLVANGFFVMKILMRFYQRNGQISSNARLMAFVAAILQAPLVIWMAMRPFFQ